MPGQIMTFFIFKAVPIMFFTGCDSDTELQEDLKNLTPEPYLRNGIASPLIYTTCLQNQLPRPVPVLFLREKKERGWGWIYLLPINACFWPPLLLLTCCCTTMGIGKKVGPRLRDSHILALSGHRGEFRQPRANFLADPCMSYSLPSKRDVLEHAHFSQSHLHPPFAVHNHVQITL